MLTGNTLLTPRYDCSWAEFQTMIVPQPAPGGGTGGGSWASRPAPAPVSAHPCTLSVSGLARGPRVAPSCGPGTQLGVGCKTAEHQLPVASGGQGPLQSWEQMGLAQPAAQ